MRTPEEKECKADYYLQEMCEDNFERTVAQEGDRAFQCERSGSCALEQNQTGDLSVNRCVRREFACLILNDMRRE